MHTLSAIGAAELLVRLRALLGRDTTFRDVDHLSDHLLRDIGLARTPGHRSMSRF